MDSDPLRPSAEPPYVVVTSGDKDIQGTLDCLGYESENAYLFDDNIDLYGQQKVVLVEPLMSSECLSVFW